MTGTTQSRFHEELERFARGELDPAEARKLAQSSLESPTRFDQLTDISLARAAVASVSVPAEPARRVWWRPPIIIATASFVVLVLVASIYLERISRKRSEAALTAESRPATTDVLPKPTLAFIPGSAQPVLLAKDLRPAVTAEASQVFRGQAEPARAPRQTGSIISIDDGLATIDLGSMDGLRTGTEVEVYRDKAFTDPAGHLRISTVFREQARGDIGDVDFEAQYAVRVNDSTHLQALLQQVRDFDARGQWNDARLAAQKVVTWGKTANAPLEIEEATELLARLDFRSGDLRAAEAQYRAALEILNRSPRASVRRALRVRNDLAALLILRGDYDSAQKLLASSGDFALGKELDAYRLNNLGVLAEARGDRHGAELLYAQASSALPRNSPYERTIVESNLSRVKGSR